MSISNFGNFGSSNNKVTSSDSLAGLINSLPEPPASGQFIRTLNQSQPIQGDNGTRH